AIPMHDSHPERWQCRTASNTIVHEYAGTRAGKAKHSEFGPVEPQNLPPPSFIAHCAHAVVFISMLLLRILTHLCKYALTVVLGRDYDGFHETHDESTPAAT